MDHEERVQDFAGYETEVKVKMSAADIANENHKIMEKSTWKHPGNLNPESWAFPILTSKDLRPNDLVARILRFDDTEDSAIDTVFIVAENTEVVSCQSVRNLTGNDSLCFKSNDNEEHLVTLSELVLYPTQTAVNNAAHIIMSSKFMVKFWSGRMCLQFSESHSLFIRPSTLYPLLERQFHIVTAGLSFIPQRTNITFPESLTRLSNLRDAVRFFAAKVKDNEDYNFSLSQANSRTRRAAMSMFDKLNEERIKNGTVVHSISERLGPIHEGVVRQAVAITSGLEWGAAIEIQGFADAISFVGRGLALSASARADARDVLVTRFCRSFEGFDVKLLVDDPSFQEHYEAASPYLRLIAWTSAAQIAPGFRSNGFSETVNSIVKSIARHKRLCSELVPGKDLEEVLAGELKKDDTMCMVLLWLLAEPARYTPKQKHPWFGSWPTPTVKLEFDHRGCFMRISRDYEGGESKASFSAVWSARQQLLRRFSLIDVISRSAFRVQVYYTGIVYVPSIPETSDTEHRMSLPWARPEAADAQIETTQPFPWLGCLDFIPDKATAIIRVSIAPGFFQG